MLPALLLMAVVTHSAPATSTLAYTASVSVTTTDPRGKVTRQAPIVARTVVRGDSARADFREGMGDYRAGDVMLTHDGGKTIYVIKSQKRKYTVIDVNAMGPTLHDAISDGPLKLKADRITVGFERLGSAPIAGYATRRVRVTRNFQLTMRMVLFKKRIPTHETLDLWLSEDLPRLPNPLGGLFLAVLDATARASDDLSRRMVAIDDSVGTGAPLKVVHRLLTGPEGDQVETVTTIEATDFGTPADNVSFEIPKGLRRDDS